MGASERAEPVAQPVTSCVRRAAGFAICGQRRIRKGDGGDEQRLATARDHEGKRGRALVSALRRARYARGPAPASCGHSIPPKTSGQTCPCPLTRRMGRSPSSKEGYWHGKNVQYRYRGKPHLAASEGEEGSQRERRDALRQRAFGALLAPDAKRRVPQVRTNGDRHHNPKARAGALVRTRGQAESFVR
jgi:hypothetical protein